MKENKYPRAVETGRQIVESPNLGVIDVRPGKNAVIFTLPPTITPVTVRFAAQYPNVAEAGKPQKARYSLELIQLDTHGIREHYTNENTRSRKGDNSEYFTALPGQTWSVSAVDYEGGDYAKRLEAEQMVIVKGDTILTLKMKKAAL